MSTLAAGLDSGAALELSVIALVVALGVVVYVARRGRGGAYMGALVVAAVGLPLVATLITLWTFLSAAGAAAMPIGIGATLIFWLLAAVALRPFTAPDAANATEFGNLRERWRLLQARAETLRADSANAVRGRHESDAAAAARRQVCGLVDEIDGELNGGGHLKWVLGSGYVHVWNLVHRAEETLVDLDPVETVIRNAYNDRLRLLGASEINYHENLLNHLTLAVEALSPEAKQYFVDPPGQDLRPAGGTGGVNQPGGVAGLSGLFGVARTVPRTAAGSAGPPAFDPGMLARSSANGSAAPATSGSVGTAGATGAAGVPAAVSLSPVAGQPAALLPGPPRTTLPAVAPGRLTQPEARAILREIRRAVNEFRDERRGGLVRARNRLLTAVMFTALTAYALLALATDVGGQAGALDARRAEIMGVGAFFLVGAVVGLFNRMHADAGTDAAVAAVEDYGFSRAQLWHTPLFSGLAALGGVALLALLPAVAPTPSASAPSPAPAGTGGQSAPAVRQVPAPPPVGDIFDLSKNPAALLVAAVFGLTPSLLTDRLRQQAENYKSDLRSSQASNRQPVSGRT